VGINTRGDSLIYLFCHSTDNNTKMMSKEKQKKDEGMMVTVARRPKGNYEAYVN